MKMRRRNMGELKTRNSKCETRNILKGVFMLVLLLSLASAQTIGGEVIVDSRYDVNPDWQNVFVYDVENVRDYKEVLVSPDGFRYSFSNINVEDGKTFSDEAYIVAEILDFENGFMAGPVNMQLGANNNKYYSCTDCEIFPKMEFREVVQIKEPNRQLYVSSEGTFPLEVNVYDDCDSYFMLDEEEIEDGIDWEQFCWFGCDYRENKSVDFGLSEIQIITDCHTGKRYKAADRPQENFLNGEWVDYSKEMKVHEDYYEISFIGEKAEGDFPVVDFLPDEFEVFNVSDGGRVYDEDGYYAIEWLASEQVAGEQVGETESGWGEDGTTFEFSYMFREKSKLENCNIGLRDENDRHYGWEVGGNIDIIDNDFWFECNFSDELSVYVVESVNFSRTLDKKIKNKEGISVVLNGEISENVSGIEFREYVPVEFEVSEISDGGVLAVSSSSYNVIIWTIGESDNRTIGEENLHVMNDVILTAPEDFDTRPTSQPTSTEGFIINSDSIEELEGFEGIGDEIILQNYSSYIGDNNFEFFYNIMPTTSGDFSFAAELGGEMLDETNITVYDFVPPIGKSKGGSSGGYVYKPKNFSKVTPEHPLIDKKDNLTAGLYSNKYFEKAAFEIFGMVPNNWNKTLKLYEAFSFETDLGDGVGNFAFEYKADRDDLEFYGTNKNGKRSRITGMSVYSDGEDFVYTYDGEFLRDISIWTEKGLNWFQRFLKWIGF